MCEHWSIKRSEVSEEEWFKILDMRGENLNDKWFGRIYFIGLALSVLYLFLGGR